MTQICGLKSLYDHKRKPNKKKKVFEEKKTLDEIINIILDVIFNSSFCDYKTFVSYTIHFF